MSAVELVMSARGMYAEAQNSATICSSWTHNVPGNKWRAKCLRDLQPDVAEATILKSVFDTSGPLLQSGVPVPQTDYSKLLVQTALKVAPSTETNLQPSKKTLTNWPFNIRFRRKSWTWSMTDGNSGNRLKVSYFSDIT